MAAPKHPNKPAWQGHGDRSPAAEAESKPETIEEHLRAVISRVTGVDPDEIQLGARLVGDLGADSLDLYEVVMVLEEELSVCLPAEYDVMGIETFGDFVRLIENPPPLTEEDGGRGPRLPHGL